MGERSDCMVIGRKKKIYRLEELEQRIAALEKKMTERKEEQKGMAIPADIISEWLNGKKME